MRSAATLAIAGARARSLWPAAIGLIVLSAGASVGLHAVQAPLFWLIANVVFVSTIAIAIAYANGRPSHADAYAAIEDSAPLFGRQRARANAIVPGAVVLISAGVQYLGALLIFHATVLPVLFLLNALGAITALPIALSVPLRSHWNRALYAALAIGGALLCAGFGGTIFFSSGSVSGALAAAIAVALLVSFVALRQYGEALARYDPVPSAP